MRASEFYDKDNLGDEEDDKDDDILEYDSYASGRGSSIHDIKVKNNGSNAQWEDVRAVIVGHRDKQHRRLRRVWYTRTNVKTCSSDLTLKWPMDLKTVAYRRLRDDAEDQFHWDVDALPREFKVAEKVDSAGRRFWREIIPLGSKTDEEEESDWHQWMEEEGHFADIARQMNRW
ncbi:hypothetical protein CERZMDRAFT_102585 [Cercospora zeae-maydis SCOH1-5]|uniref:Uncharacterized protein n=1 Tax=Cercospora zeae-maydis SCOH1-5 TaxID=717836 RepID=A0A6A6F4N2_9PEZI|nr:hypothetical protein CERZMDRAFT_102585 [Cercospora zeae-maydis SCOH1-5]